MASALVTVQDGAAVAVAIGGANQSAGINVTQGNTVTVALTDITGVTGWQLRSVLNNQSINDLAFNASNIAINQSTGVATITMPSTEYAYFVFQSEVISATINPTVRQCFFGVYISAQGSYRVTFPATGSTLGALGTLMQAAAQMPVGDPNLALLTNVSPTNAQGAGGPTCVALLTLVSKYSGVFDFTVSGLAAAAAADVSTWSIITQTGLVAPTYTGATPSGVSGQLSTGAAGTGIALATGGGGLLTQSSQSITIGTGATGDRFSPAGLIHNSVTAGIITPFARGSYVILQLSYTNTVASRALSGLCMSLRERAFA